MPILNPEDLKEDARSCIQDALDDALPGTAIVLPPGKFNVSGTLYLPAINGLTLSGAGIDGTTLDFSDLDEYALCYDEKTRVHSGSIAHMTLHGPGEGIGINLVDWNFGELKDLRVYVFDTCARLESGADGGALHNVISNCRLTNAAQAGLHLTGAQGPHETHIEYGEISINGTGLLIDAPTAATSVASTSFESNGQAIKSEGERGQFLGIRLEGNQQDVFFGPESSYNLLRSGYWDPDKHQDLSLTKSNRVMAHGFAASATETKPPLFVPIDPMAVPLTAVTPAQKGLAVSHLFAVYEARLVTTLSYVPTSETGQVDLALCTAGGTVLASTGPTPVGKAGQRQDIALTEPVWIGPGRRYTIAISFDNAEAGFWGVTASQAGFQLGQSEVLARQKAIGFPIGEQNPVSGASGTTMTLFARIG